MREKDREKMEKLMSNRERSGRKGKKRGGEGEWGEL